MEISRCGEEPAAGSTARKKESGKSNRPTSVPMRRNRRRVKIAFFSKIVGAQGDGEAQAGAMTISAGMLCFLEACPPPLLQPSDPRLTIPRPDSLATARQPSTGRPVMPDRQLQGRPPRRREPGAHISGHARHR